MADAARALEIPVISGNVSLYNETNGEAIWPTPVVGMVGLLEDVERSVPSAFQRQGDVVLLAGEQPSPAGLAGSEYLRLTRDLVAGKPQIDLAAEVKLQRFLVAAADVGLLRSAHDIAVGGLAVALAESCIAGGTGAEVDTKVAGAALFAETQSSAIVSCAADGEQRLTAIAEEFGVTLRRIGYVGSERLRIDDIDLPIAALRDAYESGLPHALEGIAPNV
jgi:phosphoribosylformylglycinamidine synthase